MSEHRAPRLRSRFSCLRSVRVRALLCLGLVTSVVSTGTFAYWTDDVAVSGTTFTSGSINLKVNELDAVVTTELSMPSTSMVPGATSAHVFTVKNAGTSPLKYEMTGTLINESTAPNFSSTTALSMSVTKDGTDNGATCGSGTPLVTNASLTSTPTTLIVRRPAAPLAVNGTEVLCFQVTFSANAPTTLQGKTAGATFTLTATSDVS